MTTVQERLRKIASHGVSVWGDLQMEAADLIDALTAKLDQYRTEYFQALRERDDLRADKEVLLGHMATLRNVTKEPQVSLLTRLVLERMAQGGGK